MHKDKLIVREDVATWWALFASALVAIVLGTWGSLIYLKGIEKSASISDAIYRAIQLFTFNLYDYGPYPWQLEIARWLAPIATLGALFRIFSKLIMGQYLAFRLGRMKNHHVMIINDPMETLRSNGDTPIVFASIGSNGVPTKIPKNGIYVEAVNFQELIARCSITHARSVFIKVKTHGEALAWTAELKLACSKQQRSALEVAFLVDSSQDSHELKELAHLSECCLQVRVICLRDLLLTKCLDWVARSIADISSQRPAICIRLAGDSEFCADMYRSLTQLIVPVSGQEIRFEISTITPIESVEPRLEDVRKAASDFLTAVTPFDPQKFALGNSSVEEIMCFHASNKKDLLKHLRALTNLTLNNSITRLAVLVSENESHGAAISALLNTNPTERLTFITADVEQELFELVQSDSLLESIAQQIHKKYLATLKDRSGPAGRDWSELPARYRDSTRIQVLSLVFKLACLGYTIESAMAEPAKLKAKIDDQIEELSEAEHKRWMIEKRLMGWTHASERNEITKKHPSLVPYSQLSEAEKEKDRVTWREIADVIEMVRQNRSSLPTSLTRI